MVHFCIFGGHKGQLSASRCVYVTLFGGTELKRPPLARCLGAVRPPARPAREEPRYFFLSLFGHTTLKWPTLAEEYLAVLDALRAGACTAADWDRLATTTGDQPPLRVASFTVFGRLEADALPSEEEELDDLSMQRHAGNVPPPAIERLLLGIGHSGAQRLAAVRQAVAATLAHGT